MRQLDEYERGFIDALKSYAYWKDGIQYVGSCGWRLQESIQNFLNERGWACSDVKGILKLSGDPE